MTTESNPKAYRCVYCNKPYDSYENLKAHIFSEHRDKPLPTPAGMITLTINKETYTLHVEPEWTLYYLLHDILGLTGAKQFCDRGACSSCTVIMEGRPILSCMTLAIECDGKNIETVEGFATEDHPLVKAYVKHHAMQCGYCTPGFIVSSKALLDRNPNPTEQEIKEALAGNLCRCGTYPQHSKAVSEAAKKMKKETKTGS